MVSRLPHAFMGGQHIDDQRSCSEEHRRKGGTERETELDRQPRRLAKTLRIAAAERLPAHLFGGRGEAIEHIGGGKKDLIEDAIGDLFGEYGLWTALLTFLAMRGLGQAAFFRRLFARSFAPA